MIGTFIVNNLCAIILIDLNSYRNFITLDFRHLLNHKSNRLEETYIVEMDNKLLETTYGVLTNCIPIHNNHIFHINLIPTTVGNFRVVISMDWMSSPNQKFVLKKCYSTTFPQRRNLILASTKTNPYKIGRLSYAWKLRSICTRIFTSTTKIDDVAVI